MREYCVSTYQTKRFKTREVMVGPVGVGGNNPIRIQSMTTSNTRDAIATADQIMRLADAGCDIARVTVQGMKEAAACEEIKNILINRGYTIPLVADIHFYPPAASAVADFVDKIRINPGNFVDTRATFKTISYDDVSYALELEKIEEKFIPLVEKCKRLNRAMRIGTNHGSLSDRIMNRYGDTPFGMVESALEFARICRKLNYHEIIFSMKASNPVVMVQAYRLLVAKMIELGWDYPLHLGVTEAGDGEDGRVKSAVGMGSLLLDGIGDTIRVSLTEDPWHEIDPCKRLVACAENYLDRGIAPFEELHRNIEEIAKRSVVETALLHRDGSVILKVDSAFLEEKELTQLLGCNSKGLKDIATTDAIYIEQLTHSHPQIAELKKLGITTFTNTPSIENTIQIEDLYQAQEGSVAVRVALDDEESWQKIKTIKPSLIFLTGKEGSPRLHASRKFFDYLQTAFLEIPVILTFPYSDTLDDLTINASAELGALLGDKLGEGICLLTQHTPLAIRSLSFTLLQATRMRTSKTEFISCPSCGRTLFNLQDVTARIRARTSHLPGVKIAIMGCIVNGPGEMADADFGYVGSKAGKIDLYVGKICVEKNIDFLDADDRLIDLIKAHGRWVEPELLATV